MSNREIVTILVIAAIVLLLAVIWLNDRRIRRRSGTPLSGMIASFDQAFRPEAAHASEIREVQRELPAEAPAPGDPREPGATITITVSASDPR